MNCDRIARWYRWLEYAGFGGALQRARVSFLKDVADTKRALVLGEGDGRFLVELVKASTSASIDYVDLSERMLELARARAAAVTPGVVSFHRADALTIPLPDREYDLVTTHFFLDCLNESEAWKLVARVADAARPDARWLVSEFRETGWLAPLIVRALYFFFRITTGLRTTRLVDHRPLLTKAGFRLARERSSHFGLLVSELWVR